MKQQMYPHVRTVNNIMLVLWISSVRCKCNCHLLAEYEWLLSGNPHKGFKDIYSKRAFDNFQKKLVSNVAK
jgi:hypothetical protein